MPQNAPSPQPSTSAAGGASQQQQQQQQSANSPASQERSLYITFFCLTTTFFICHLPRILMNINEFYMNKQRLVCLERFGRQYQVADWVLICSFVEKFLLIFNSSINFVYYCLVGKTFRQHMCRSLFWWCGRCIKVVTGYEPATFTVTGGTGETIVNDGESRSATRGYSTRRNVSVDLVSVGDDFGCSVGSKTPSYLYGRGESRRSRKFSFEKEELANRLAASLDRPMMTSPGGGGGGPPLPGGPRRSTGILSQGSVPPLIRECSEHSSSAASSRKESMDEEAKKAAAAEERDRALKEEVAATIEKTLTESDGDGRSSSSGGEDDGDSSYSSDEDDVFGGSECSQCEAEAAAAAKAAGGRSPSTSSGSSTVSSSGTSSSDGSISDGRRESVESSSRSSCQICCERRQSKAAASVSVALPAKSSETLGVFDITIEIEANVAATEDDESELEEEVKSVASASAALQTHATASGDVVLLSPPAASAAHPEARPSFLLSKRLLKYYSIAGRKSPVFV